MSVILDMDSMSSARVVETDHLRLVSTRRVIRVRTEQASRLVFLTDPTGLASEQYRMLRRRLCTYRPEGGVLLITSPSAGEGKTLTSVNLAFCLAEGGHSTCLVDLDFRAPSLAPTLGYGFEEDGVDDLLAGNGAILQAIRRVGSRSLYVLGVRRCHSSPGRLLAPIVLTPFLKDLLAKFRWVILDSAPIIPMADVAEILPQIDGALMVIRAGKTKKALVQPSLEILGSQLWGIVINDSPVEGMGPCGYYGSRGDAL